MEITSLRTTTPLLLAIGAAAAIAFSAGAVPLSGVSTGILGMNPKLLPGADGGSIYLFAASPGASVLLFDMSTGTWQSDIPTAPGMENVNLWDITCWNGSCWGGPDYAVDENDDLHVIWAENDWLDCVEGTPNTLALPQRIKYQSYNGTGWGPVEILNDHGPGDCWVEYPSIGSDKAGRLLVAYNRCNNARLEADGSVNCDPLVAYRVRDAGGTWLPETRVASVKRGTSAAGAGGMLYLGYTDMTFMYIAQLAPGSSTITSSDSFLADTVPTILPENAADYHVTWRIWHWDDNHFGTVFYNHKRGGSWEYADSPILADHSILVPPTSGEADAMTSLGTTSAGYRLLSIAYGRKLYSVVYDGSRWGAPVERETGEEVYSAVAHGLSGSEFLLVWSTAMDTGGQVKYAVVDADPCSLCGPGQVCLEGQCVPAGDASEPAYEPAGEEAAEAAPDAETAEDAAVEPGGPDAAEDPDAREIDGGMNEMNGGCGCALAGI